MSGMKQLCNATRRVGILLLVLGAGLFATSCGKDGKIFGEVDWDYYLYSESIGGFPSSGYRNTYYPIGAGTYEVDYTLYDGNFYYPGWQMSDPFNPAYYWIGHYTVDVEKGSFPFVDGKDHYFSLYLGWNGMSKSGSVRSIEIPPQNPKTIPPKLGTQSWAEDGLLITVTNEIAKLTPEEISRMPKTHFEK